MKIYQIHEFSGAYEDFRDYIVGTYLHKDRAEKEMQALIENEGVHLRTYEKCLECPIEDLEVVGDDALEVMRKTCAKYCDQAQIYEDVYGFECENNAANYFEDEKIYELKEVEVIE